MSVQELLKHLEWSSYRVNQDGRLMTACPYCHQLKSTSEAKACFVSSAVGHKTDCELKKQLVKK